MVTISTTGAAATGAKDVRNVTCVKTRLSGAVVTSLCTRARKGVYNMSPVAMKSSWSFRLFHSEVCCQSMAIRLILWSQLLSVGEKSAFNNTRCGIG